LYSPEAMAVPSSATPQAGATTKMPLPTRISVGKVSKQAYFRHNPELRLTTRLINHVGSRAFYYPIGDEVTNTLSEFVNTVELYGCVTKAGVFQFWPINVIEMENDWNDSARELLDMAVEEWVGYRSAEGRYLPRYPQGDLGEPVWPQTTMQDLLARAFRGVRTIKSLDHKVARELLGRG
jgi:hypothetical protein